MHKFSLTVYLFVFAFFSLAYPNTSNASDTDKIPPMGVYCALNLYSTMKANLEKCADIPNLKKDLVESYFWATVIVYNKDLRDISAALSEGTALLSDNGHVKAMIKGEQMRESMSPKISSKDYMSQYSLSKKFLSEKNFDLAYYWVSVAERSSPLNDARYILGKVGKHLSSGQKKEIEERRKLWSPVTDTNEEVSFEKGKSLFASKPEEAVVLIEKAAMTGNIDAQLYLAKAYMDGEGDISDREFLERINDAIAKIHQQLKMESPLLQSKSQAGLGSLFPPQCSSSDVSRRLVNRYKNLPKEVFDKNLEEILAQPGPPSLNPCI